ncbi:MAG: hypothetical protein ACLU99_14685 [Alphaproteobacteria bacterium]
MRLIPIRPSISSIKANGAKRVGREALDARCQWRRQETICAPNDTGLLLGQCNPGLLLVTMKFSGEGGVRGDADRNEPPRGLEPAQRRRRLAGDAPERLRSCQGVFLMFQAGYFFFIAHCRKSPLDGQGH